MIPYREGDITWIIPNWFSLYGFLIFLGMVASILTIVYFWKRKKYSVDILFTLIFITIPSSILGARLWFIFEQLGVPNSNISSTWWKINEGGLSIQGGVILPTILDLLYLYKKRKEVDYREAFSFILPAVLIGQAIGRWGNFANHEVFGQIDIDGSHSKWLGWWISDNMYITKNGQDAYRIPLFFYEFLASTFGYIVLVWIFNFFGWFKPGITGAMYLIYYGIVRASMEFTREEAYMMYFVFAILYIVVGSGLLIYFHFLSDFIYVIEKNENKTLSLKIDKKQRYTKEKYKLGKFTITNYQRIIYENN
ncbi:prolipoprotein diacylglyceryl transferase [Mycoplasma iguanae]|uniref:Phosphatidylglycerol--prolipoprotein diacylglyceryl transferase n=1 Tax=Mycoplasma iguanae TaxID=292461 RepID=A0ABY5RAA8_9MOLU|nr:prolipoprotein diacylglyceryl transferase [Mycoplasma iguanae]UVD81697.1 prolipoprotein diacylglyceryl transferase [Mycoplasma iguanae]